MDRLPGGSAPPVIHLVRGRGPPFPLPRGAGPSLVDEGTAPGVGRGCL